MPVLGQVASEFTGMVKISTWLHRKNAAHLGSPHNVLHTLCCVMLQSVGRTITISSKINIVTFAVYVISWVVEVTVSEKDVKGGGPAWANIAPNLN